MVAPTILCVDDEPLVVRALSRIVTSMGFRAQVCSGGEDALAALADGQHPLCITDLRMPGIGGAELIRRARERSPDTLFLVVTGTVDIDLRADPLIEEALVGILEKPWGPDEIQDSVQRALELYDRRTRASTARSQTRLLLIEDEAGDAALLREWLAEDPSAPVDVDVVRRLSDAISRLHEEPYDILISDLTLPDARGLDAVARLHRAAPQAALLVLTGLADEELAAQALRHGAQDYLVKQGMSGQTLRRAVRFARERKSAQRALARRAAFDELTGLANRSTLIEKAHASLARGRRHKEGFAVLFLDLDGFKGINDTLGHEAGDTLLQEVARRLGACLREGDTAARLGGDEFVLLLEDVGERAAVEDVAERVLREMARPFRLAGQDMAITTSAGVAMYPSAGRDVDTLLRAADAALYRAKGDGKNVCRFFKRDVSANVAPGPSIKGAAGRGELSLHYQEHVRLSDRSVLGYEGLLRWEPSRGKIVPPAQFLSHLESTGEIVAAGGWALEAGCRELVALRTTCAQARLSLNVSPQQLEDGDLVTTVDAALAQAGLEPDALELEVSENTLLHPSRAAMACLQALVDRGVRLTIDDFGAGHGSLMHLMRAPVHCLKLDSALVKGIEQGARAMGVVGGLISLANDLGLLVIAKGVERDRQVELLRRVGCEVAQGFLFGAPRAAPGTPTVGHREPKAA